LSQRLSHACLRMTDSYSVICERLRKTVIVCLMIMALKTIKRIISGILRIILVRKDSISNS